MKRVLTLIRTSIGLLWTADRPLTGTGLMMLGLLAVFTAAMALDPRVVAGAPAWLKPAKFALSTGVYSLTLAWVFAFLEPWPRTRRVVGWATTAAFVIEVGIIGTQAARGTSSHFNVATRLDAVLFAVMGTAIALQTLASGLVAVALWRQPFADRALGAALRAGMVITILGAASAGFMTRMTDAQAAELRDAGRLPTAGAHTVGAPDGGAGLPGVGWSRDHGDLRIPHFVGLHGLQFLAVVGVLLGRRSRDRHAVRLVRAAASSYASLVALLLVQALRGEALLRPSATTLLVFLVWGAGTGLAVWATSRRRNAIPMQTAMVGA